MTEKVCGHCHKTTLGSSAYPDGLPLVKGIMFDLPVMGLKFLKNPLTAFKKKGTSLRCHNCKEWNNICPYCEILVPITAVQVLDEIRCPSCSNVFTISL